MYFSKAHKAYCLVFFSQAFVAADRYHINYIQFVTITTRINAKH